MANWVSHLRYGAAIVCIGLIAGCASVETALPMPDAKSLQAETGRQETLAFARLNAMQLRLGRMSADILRANADLCEDTYLDPGIILHSQKAYPKPLREAAARQAGAAQMPSVLHIRSDSPAAQAGIKPGDNLLDQHANPRSVMHKDVQAALAEGYVQIRRGDEDIRLDISGAPKACAYPVRLKISGAVNAYANGKAIIVTTGMMEFADNDRDLAMVIGHELAHNTMKHVRKSIQNFILSGFAHRYTRPFESEADYVGLYYLARAGYDLDGAQDFWQRLGTAYPVAIFKQKTHPMTPDRYVSIAQTIAEIEAKRDGGEELLPNYR